MASLFLQGLPPIPGGGNVDVGLVLLNMVFAIVWTLVAGVSFAIVIPIGMRLFSALTPGIDELDELKKGNMAVALVFATFILSLTAVVVAILLNK